MFSSFFRLIFVIRTFFHYGLEELLPKSQKKFILKCLKIMLLCRNQHKDKALGVRLKTALETLGPVWIKFGQMLSTRRDLFSDDISNELAKLQDKVTPFDSATAKAIIEQNLQQNLENIFSNFEKEPLGSASIAQVHSATLKEQNKDVVIKILRPQVREKVNNDLKLMHFLAQISFKITPLAYRLRIDEVVCEYEKQLNDELDLRIEAQNTIKLRQNFENSDDLYVPHIYQQYSFENMIVVEKIAGVPVGDVGELKKRNVNFKVLAEKGVRVFFTQVFRDSFFHADMHPGNIFVDTNDPENPKYIAIDCAIIGTLNDSDKRYLAENFIAFFNRDYYKVAKLHIDSGWIADDIDIDLCAKAFEEVCDPIFQKPLGEISFGLLLVKLFEVARDFKMQVQPQLVLLQKTLLYIEGLGRNLYPQLDLWETAKPFLQNWLDEQIGFKAFFKILGEEIPHLKSDLPTLATDALKIISNQKMMKREIDKLNREIIILKNKSQPKQSKFISILACLGGAFAIYHLFSFAF